MSNHGCAVRRDRILDYDSRPRRQPSAKFLPVRFHYLALEAEESTLRLAATSNQTCFGKLFQMMRDRRLRDRQLLNKHLARQLAIFPGDALQNRKALRISQRSGNLVELL
jgi:hypothetical protein